MRYAYVIGDHAPDTFLRNHGAIDLDWQVRQPGTQYQRIGIRAVASFSWAIPQGHWTSRPPMPNALSATWASLATFPLVVTLTRRARGLLQVLWLCGGLCSKTAIRVRLCCNTQMTTTRSSTRTMPVARACSFPAIPASRPAFRPMVIAGAGSRTGAARQLTHRRQPAAWVEYGHPPRSTSQCRTHHTCRWHHSCRGQGIRHWAGRRRLRQPRQQQPLPRRTRPCPARLDQSEFEWDENGRWGGASNSHRARRARPAARTARARGSKTHRSKIRSRPSAQTSTTPLTASCRRISASICGEAR